MVSLLETGYATKDEGIERPMKREIVAESAGLTFVVCFMLV
jgi:hypothetical protein